MIETLRKALRGLSDYRAKDITDDYIFWLGHANNGMLRPGNLYCFDYAIQHMPDGLPILEIGSWAGLSANAITYYKRKHGRANWLITCDKWDFAPFAHSDRICDMPIHEYEAFIRESFKHNVSTFSKDDLPHTVQMSSDEFFEAWQANALVTDVFGRPTQLGGQFAFTYIDGNHSYAFARRDFDNCDRYLTPGGFMLFDDSGDFAKHESRLVAQEAARRKDYKLIIKNPNYLLQKSAAQTS